MRWGPTLAVRYLLRPAPGTRAGADAPDGRPELPRRPRPPAASRRATSAWSCASSGTSTTCRRRSRTPPSSGRSASLAAEPVAVLTIPRGDVSTVDALAQARVIDATGVQPVEHHRRVPSARQPQPGAQGRLRRRARRTAWATAGSRSRRCATRWPAPRRARAFWVVNRYVEWHRLPVPLGLLNLEVFRHVLRKQNLIDTELREAPPSARPVPPAAPDEKSRGRAIGRRLEQRPVGSDDGCGRLDVRPQPPTALPAGPVRRAEPGRRQPAAALPRAVPPGPVAEPPRGRLDPVPGARLGQPPSPPARRGRRRGAAARRHDLVEHAGRRARNGRCGSPGTSPIPTAGAQPMEPVFAQQDVALVGRLRGLRRRRATRPASCGRARSCE